VKWTSSPSKCNVTEEEFSTCFLQAPVVPYFNCTECQSVQACLHSEHAQ